MAKRALGLGKQNKQKKRKTNSPSPGLTEDEISNNQNEAQLNIQLDDDADLDDEIIQLKGLWKKYFNSDRDDEYILNAIIHECDRLLRLTETDESIKSKLDDEFYAIYALALSELTIFKNGDEELEQDEKKRNDIVSQFFDDALDRTITANEQFKDSQILPLVHSKIILQRIPLQYISKLNLKSKKDKNLDLLKLLQTAKDNFTIVKNDLDLTFEVLQMKNDLLDIIETFGHTDEIEEGLDSDNDEDLELLELSSSHPLFDLQKKLSNNYDWLHENLLSLLENIKDENSTTYKGVSKSIGDIYLKKAEKPTAAFISIQYGDEDDDNEEEEIVLSTEDQKRSKEHQQKAKKYVKKALEYLKKAQKEDDPETWVQVSEALITLGNLEDNKSSEQEDAYSEAQKLLEKANVSSHGKYQVVLDNLLAMDDD